MPPRKSWEDVKKASMAPKTPKSHSTSTVEDEDKEETEPEEQIESGGSQSGQEGREEPGGEPKEEGTSDEPLSPSLNPLGIDTPGAFDGTYRADATVTGRMAVLGNMVFVLPAAGVDILPKGNVSNFQATRLTAWPVVGTPKVLTATVAPLASPKAKNWRLKNGPLRKTAPPAYRKYTWNGTTDRIVIFNGLPMRLAPGQFIIGRYIYADEQLEYWYAGDQKNGRSSTLTTIAAVTVAAITNPTVATITTTGVTATGTYTPVGTATYQWTATGPKVVTLATPTAISTVITIAGAVAGDTCTATLTVTDTIPGYGVLVTTSSQSFTVLA